MRVTGEPLYVTEPGYEPVYKEVLSCGHFGDLATPRVRARRRRCPTCGSVRSVVELRGNGRAGEGT